jgi:hypothetical protein
MQVERLESRSLLSVVPAGSEFQVNTSTTIYQDTPSVAVDADGDFVITWNSAHSEYGDVYAQRYSAAGVRQGDEFRVNTYTTLSQANPSVAMDAYGDFVIVWSGIGEEDIHGIYAQRYDAAGAPLGGEFRVNTVTTPGQSNPRVAMNHDGDFVVAWVSYGQDGSHYGTYAQRYDAAGVPQGGEFPVNTYTTGRQYRPSVAIEADGDFVIAWASGAVLPSGVGQDGSSYGVYAQRYSAAGVPQGGEFRVNTYTTGNQTLPQVALDSGGNCLIVWGLNGPSGLALYARRYDPTGTPQGAEFAVVSLTTGPGIGPRYLGADADGNFIVTWTPLSNGPDVYARRLNAAGTPQGDPFRINTYTTSNQQRPCVAMNPNGDFVIAWDSFGQDGSLEGIYAQRYAVVPEIVTSSFGFDTAPQRVIVGFNHDVSASLGSDDLLVQNLTTNQTISSNDFSLAYDTSTNQAAFNYTAGLLPDGNYRATLLAAGIATPQGAPLTSDFTLDFFVLAGDADHDRDVDVNDLGILATNWQQSPRTFAQGDFDYTGTVDVNDLGILATHWQQHLATLRVPIPAAPGKPAVRRLITEIL